MCLTVIDPAGNEQRCPHNRSNTNNRYQNTTALLSRGLSLFDLDTRTTDTRTIDVAFARVLSR